MTATDPSRGVAVDQQVLAARAKAITERELARYADRTPGSRRATERARKVLPLGVPSSIQFFEPHPIVVGHAAGSRMSDVDGNEYVDFDMGFGALFAGHVNPVVRKAIEAQLDDGTLYVTPCEMNATVAELLADRYRLPMWRFTNSGTEATMDAIRVAKAATGREKLVKVEGGYHGHHDDVMVSMKPPLDQAGPPDAPISLASSAGVARHIVEATKVVPFNDPEALERVLANDDIACFIVEPVMENIGICLPEPGYLEAIREITERHGTLLIFDEVKTGITAGYGGATAYYGVQPDLVTLAKSIGGGFPVGAFGGRQELMDLITAGTVAHYGTYNGNPLVMAACRATLSEACAPGPTDEAIARNTRLVAACQASSMPPACRRTPCSSGPRAASPGRWNRSATTATTRRPTSTWPTRIGCTGSTAACCCRPASTSSGSSPSMHTEEEAMCYADVFAEFVDELTS